jgi:hypothetical protein
VSKNPEFYADFRSEEIIQKQVLKKVRPTKHFSGDLGGFFEGKKVFWDYLFWYIFSE